jgi:hypothetical protein
VFKSSTAKEIYLSALPFYLPVSGSCCVAGQFFDFWFVNYFQITELILYVLVRVIGVRYCFSRFC